MNMNNILTGLVISFGTLLLPIQGLFTILLAFILFDTIFAVYSVLKLEGIKSIRSHKMFNLAVKVFFYFSAVLLGFLIDKFMFDTIILSIHYLIAKVITGIFVNIEVKSIEETAIKLGSKPFMFYFRNLFNKLTAIKTDLEKLIK